MFEQNQIVQYPATLLGAKKFKGDIDGNKIDSCTVLVATPMPSATGNAVGFTAANMRFGESNKNKKLAVFLEFSQVCIAFFCWNAKTS